MGRISDTTPEDVGFLLLPGFSLMGVTAGIDVLRHSNRLSGKTNYTWKLLTPDGQAVSATNGLELSPNCLITDVAEFAYVFVCGGYHPERFRDARVLTWLRRIARYGTQLGAITTGSYQLAQAGLLDGYACSIHWENAKALAHDFPNVEVRDSLFIIDRNRYTCSGATAALDMFLQIVTTRISAELAVRVAEQLQLDRIREGTHEQATLHRAALSVKSRHMAKAIAIMEDNLESPLKIPELAQRVGLTRRQVQRLFRRYTDMGPADYYLRIRLERARAQVTQTSDRILDIAIENGFESHSHFTKSYREHFGVTPRDDRKQSQ